MLYQRNLKKNSVTSVKKIAMYTLYKISEMFMKLSQGFWK